MPSSSGRRRVNVRFAALALVAAAAVAGAAGCSAGQVTQTATHLAAVNGDSAQVGAVQVSNATLAYPEGGYWSAGSDVGVSMTITNNGPAADELQRIAGSISDDIPIDGATVIPSRRALTIGGQPAPSTPKADSGTDAGAAGKATVVLSEIKKNLFPGMVVDLTLTFRDAGTVTLRVPIAAPEHPRSDLPAEEH
ncbi:MAG: hypothetical protein ACRDQB_08815 [Thermocrispum sp.]